MKLGELIKSFRESKGLSKIELAERAGVSQTHIQNIEIGKREGTFETINKLLGSLGLKSIEGNINQQINISELVSLLTDMDNNGSETISISLVLNKLK
jgi:transcriptional regulator with XRE-family HTH domain